MKVKAIVMIILALVLCNVETAESTNYNYDKVILIAWDGSQYEKTKMLYDSGELNGMEEVLKDGSWMKLYITDHMTWTDPGYAQMLSGYSPDITGMDGIVDWVTREGIWQILPDGLSVFENLPDDITTAVINSRDAIKKTYPDGIRLPHEYEEGYKGHGYFEWNFQNAMPEIDYYWDSSDYSDETGMYKEFKGLNIYLNQIDAATTEAKAEEWIADHTQDRFFMFIHLGEPDATAHNNTNTASTTEYLEAIKTCDTATAKLINYLKELEIYEDTVVIITTDHGFGNNMSHYDFPYPNGSGENYLTFVAINKDVLKSNTRDDQGGGYQGDIAPTIYELFGINYKKIKPAFDFAKPIWKRVGAWQINR